MTTISHEPEQYLVEAAKSLYVGQHREAYNAPLDKAKSHGTPYVGKHIGRDAATSAQTEAGRRDPIDDTHGRWTLRIHDDQPLTDGKTFAADNRVEVLHDGVVFKKFLYPGYRIWTLLAHWKDSLDPDGVPEAQLAEGSES